MVLTAPIRILQRLRKTQTTGPHPVILWGWSGPPNLRFKVGSSCVITNFVNVRSTAPGDRCERPDLWVTSISESVWVLPQPFFSHSKSCKQAFSVCNLFLLEKTRVIFASDRTPLTGRIPYPKELEITKGFRKSHILDVVIN